MIREKGDWIDARFGLESKKSFLEQFDNFFELHLERDYPIPVRFFGSFDATLERAVRSVATACFDIAKEAGFLVYHVGPRVEFYTPQAWAKQFNPPPELPAARMEKEANAYLIQVVLASSSQSSEVVVKTARLLCAKLFGSIFFELHVPRRPPYLLLQEGLTEIPFDQAQKGHLIRLLELDSPALQRAARDQAQALSLRGPKMLEVGRKELLKSFLQGPLEAHPAYQPVQTLFQEVIQTAQADLNGFFDSLSSRILAETKQSHFILPHELPKFEFQQRKRVWALFHALEERLQLLTNGIEELSQCYAYLETHGPKVQDPALIASWAKELGLRLRQLRKSGLVKLFLLEEAKLGEKAQGQRLRFPLWLFQKKLIQPQGPPGEKQVEQLTKAYQNAIYQKLFELSFRLRQILKGKKDLGKAADLTRIKTLVTTLRMRQENLTDLLHAARVGKSMQGLAQAGAKPKSQVLAEFEEGWSYFISFALLHQYYKLVDAKKQDGKSRANEFERVIAAYVKEQVAAAPAYQVAELLLKFYQKAMADLSRMRPLLTDPSPTLDFFLLHHKELLQQGDNPLERIDSFSSKLAQWQSERYKHGITPEEKQAYSRKFTGIA